MAAISVVAYRGIQNNANDAAVRSSLRDNFGKIALYHAEHGVYPSSEQQLVDLDLSFSHGAFYMSNNLFLYCYSATDSQKAALVGRVVGMTRGYSYSSTYGLREVTDWGSSMYERCRLAYGDVTTANPIQGISSGNWLPWTGAN